MNERVDVVVVGSGAAGVAAARTAADLGASVLLVSAGIGASALSPGWIHTGPSSESLPHWLIATGFRPWAAYRFVSLEGDVVAASSGLPSLLAVPSARVGVLDLAAGPAWDAESVVATMRERDPSVDARVVRLSNGAPGGDGLMDLARRFDSDGSIDALVGSLAASGVDDCDAFLLPPVLGLERTDVSERLSERLGRACGETGGGPGDPPSVRFDRILQRAVPERVRRVRARATVHVVDGELEVRWSGSQVRAPAVVLATGGLLGGGIAFRDGAFVETCGGWPLHLGVTGTVDGAVSASGLEPGPWFLGSHAEAHGIPPVALRRAPSDRVRVMRPDGQVIHPGLAAAGEVAADLSIPRPPAIGDALAAGVRAASELLQPRWPSVPPS